MKNLSTLLICFLVVLLIAALSSCGSAEARRAESKAKSKAEVVTTTNTTEVAGGQFLIKVKRRENAERVLYYDSTVTFIPTKEVQSRYTTSSELHSR